MIQKRKFKDVEFKDIQITTCKPVKIKEGKLYGMKWKVWIENNAFGNVLYAYEENKAELSYRIVQDLYEFMKKERKIW